MSQQSPMTRHLMSCHAYLMNAVRQPAVPPAPGPVRRVCVVSTGTVQIRPEHVGPTRQNTYVWLLLTARRWTPPRPINAYVIEHQEGVVLFDTGQDMASVTDPRYFPGGPTGYLYDRLA